MLLHQQMPEKIIDFCLLFLIFKRWTQLVAVMTPSSLAKTHTAKSNTARPQQRTSTEMCSDMTV
jgi:hypothetical protein